MSQVVFSAEQLSWLSVEQAWAVTEEQWAELDAEQRHAVDLARYEGDVLMELRGVCVVFFFLEKCGEHSSGNYFVCVKSA